jgi:hypothetical protein
VNHWDVQIIGNAVQGNVKSGCFGGNGSKITKVTFIEADNGSLPQVPYEYLMIHTSLWDEEWKKDQMNYLPSDLDKIPFFRESDINYSDNKIKKLTNKVINEGIINSPSFNDAPPGARLTIADGRHRFYLLRQLGIDAFPAAVPVSIIDRLNNLGLLA